MIFQTISFLDADRYSAWPKRLLGLKHWEKTKRSQQEILKEYNDGWYKKAYELWQIESQADPLIRPLRFFRLLDKIINEEVLKNPDIYGVSEDEYLISINKNLFSSSYFTAR